jgi:hypothetical protein
MWLGEARLCGVSGSPPLANRHPQNGALAVDALAWLAAYARPRLIAGERAPVRGRDRRVRRLNEMRAGSRWSQSAGRLVGSVVLMPRPTGIG